jgi:uncharacterized protein with von Willebrand factor type A (vWA) domain
MQLLMPQMKQKAETATQPENRRLAEAMFAGASLQPPRPEDGQRIEIDAALSWTDREQLRKADFDTMSAAEWAAARRLLAR